MPVRLDESKVDEDRAKTLETPDEREESIFIGYRKTTRKFGYKSLDTSFSQYSEYLEGTR